MKSLVWKEMRENLKWVPLPGLAIFLAFLIDKPDEPMLDVTGAFFFCLTSVLFGTALGFLQVFFEGHGDKRSLLLQRPLTPSRIFLAKAIAGVGLYLLALGIPFVCLEGWKAKPGNMPAPYDWRTSLPWLADILSGLVYYFAGMLTAQRDVRWYASRGLALAAAFLCSYLVWLLPEFWQALTAIGIFGSFMSLAAWGSFLSGGAYAAQPRLARFTLAIILLAGLLMVSMFGKQLIGEWFDSETIYQCEVERQGRVLAAPCREGAGRIGPWLDVRNGQETSDLPSKVTESSRMAPGAIMETPLYRSYRNSGRFYVESTNDSKPSQERWFYDQAQHRLLGYDKIYRQFLGSFGPNGFTPAGDEPTERFQGELRHRRFRWGAVKQDFLPFPGAVYHVNFARRTIRTFFAPAAGETVTFAGWWVDELDRKRKLVVVSTNKSFHFLTAAGAPVVSIPRNYDYQKDAYVAVVGLLENPERYFVWYRSLPFEPLVGPEEYKKKPFRLIEYDAAGREVAHRSDRSFYPLASHANMLHGLVTPMAEAAALVATAHHLRSEARSQGSTHKSVLLSYLDSMRYYIPGTSRFKETPRGSILVYVALMVLSAAASAFGCLLLAGSYAFSRVSSIAWTLVGLFFGWVGLVLMLAVQEWPARVSCPNCRRLRVVTRDTCEHCGALHALPEPDGAEILESAATVTQVALIAR